MKPIDIVPADLEIVRQILQDFVPEIEVRAFGSRVAWSARETSDLDLALMTDERLPDSCSMNLREAFSESELPFKVDLIDWATTSDNFRKVIESEYVVVQVGDKETSYSRISTVTNNWLYQPQFKKSWQRKPLYSLAKWVNGLAFKNIKFSSIGMPIIKIAEMKNGISGQTKFTQQTFDDSVRVRSGDMIFSWSGQPETSINVFWWRGAEGWLNQHLFRVTPIGSIDPTFFYYLLRYLRPNFIGIARNKQTTGLGHVTKLDLEEIEAAYPVRSEQRIIAHILGTLDDKIELNRQMNETLETIARALFKSWFVDFDPVRAKMEGRQPAGMNSKLAALFPDSFDDSELGEIPKGWLIISLRNEIQVTKGRSYRSSELAASKVALVTLKSIKRGGGYRADGLKPFTGTYKREQIIAAGELVVAYTDVTQAAEVIGKPAIVRHDRQFDKLVASLDLAIVRPTARLSVPYLFCLFRESKFQDHAYAHTTGTTVLHLEKNAIPSYMTTLPPSKLCKEFKRITSPMFEEIEANASESKCLSALREGLLAPLVSGQMTPHLNGVQSDD